MFFHETTPAEREESRPGWHSKVTRIVLTFLDPSTGEPGPCCFCRAFAFLACSLCSWDCPALGMEQDKEGRLREANMIWLLASPNSSAHLSSNYFVFKPLHGEPICPGCSDSAHETQLPPLQFLLPEVVSSFSCVFLPYPQQLRFYSRHSLNKIEHYYKKTCNSFKDPQFIRCPSIKSLMYLLSILLIWKLVWVVKSRFYSCILTYLAHYTPRERIPERIYMINKYL